MKVNYTHKSMSIDLPPIPPHLQKMAEGIDRTIEELKQYGPEKFMNEWIEKEGKVKPILDEEVLQLQKIGLGVMASNNVMHHQIFHAHVWNKLLDITYDKVRTEMQLKKCQEKLDSLNP